MPAGTNFPCAARTHRTVGSCTLTTRLSIVQCSRIFGEKRWNALQMNSGSIQKVKKVVFALLNGLTSKEYQLYYQPREHRSNSCIELGDSIKKVDCFCLTNSGYLTACGC
ncbi:uncharacterized protein LOC128860900 [Anastrepha ludens]|uniref:uncharacterized protein LOC128860900 n=1 Tax=Anastrepha ludens TaxID=28586 RepID=UPI0023AF6EB0|nr:uncharacterized protein LOC128860900 [Anastrepha ludens]